MQLVQREVQCLENCNRKTCVENTALTTVYVKWDNIKMDLKYDVKMWTVSIWFVVGSSDRIL
jgi:hypothetical protein